MSPQDLITEVIGDGWSNEELPYLLEFLKRSILDADRYSFIRDYSSEVKFGKEPRDRLEMKIFDDFIDAKQTEY